MNRLHDERGFVLSLVIFAVSALSIAGTALYLVAQSETAMARSGAESSSAFHAANAGLARYMGENLGQPAAQQVYQMSHGTVTVRATRIMAQGDTSDIYLIESEAVIPDRRVRHLVSRRAVQQFAVLNKRPFRPIAGMVLAGNTVRTGTIVVDGRDQCTLRPDVAGVATLGGGSVRGTINGTPLIRTDTFQGMMAAIGLDWAAMTDPAFEFEYEVPSEPWPRFSLGIAADEYPTIRVRGDLTATADRSGRGLLLVTGDITFYDGFTWDGAILAGGMPPTTSATFTVNGALLTGFAGADTRVEVYNGTVRYDSCKVLAASQRIALFSPLASTWWENSE